MSIHWLRILTQVIYGMFGAALWLVLLHGCQPASPRIGVVNLTGLVNGYVKTVAQENLSKHDASTQVQAFADRLETAIKRLSQQRHMIIMPAAAVIAGSPNMTDELVKRLPDLNTLTHDNTLRR